MTLNEAIADGFAYSQQDDTGNTKSCGDIKVAKRHVPRLCFVDDRGGEIDGIRCPVCHRVHLRA